MKKCLLNNNEIVENDENYNITFVNKDEITSKKIKEIPEPVVSMLDFEEKHIKLDFYKDCLFGNLLLNKYIFNVETSLFFIYQDNRLYLVFEKENKKLYTQIVSLMNQNLDKFSYQFDNIFIIVILIIKLMIENDLKYAQRLKRKLDKIEDILIIDKQTKNYNIKLLKLKKQLTKFRIENDNIKEFLDIIEYHHDSFEDLNNVIRLIEYQNKHLEKDIKTMIDHIIHIKEVYQNQLDVSLNHTMNLFTVISAIFLPLTLVTSWYGMNHIMPEYTWKYGYLVPIILSIWITLVIFYFIKKYNFLKR